MSDPVTPNRGLTLPTVGADSGTWGGIVNADLTLIDTALAKAGFMASFDAAADVTIAGGGIVIFNTTAGSGYNLGSAYSTVTGRYTVPVTGFYQVNCGLYLTNSGGNTQQMYASTYVNGTATSNGVDAYPSITGIPNGTGGVILLPFGAVLFLNAGDILDIRTAPAVPLRIYKGKSWFGAHLICAN